MSLSSSACGGGTTARKGLRTGPGIETGAGAPRQGWVSILPILESGTDDAAGSGKVVSDVAGNVAEGMADVAAAEVVAGTTVSGEADGGGLELGPELGDAATGSV